VDNLLKDEQKTTQIVVKPIADLKGVERKPDTKVTWICCPNNERYVFISILDPLTSQLQGNYSFFTKAGKRTREPRESYVTDF
jgi:hypothetical protein